MSRPARPMRRHEWPVSDELWRMLHHVLAAGPFSACKQFLFCVGVCRLRGDAVPAEYRPILDDLEALADSPDLPALRPGQGFWEWHADRNLLPDAYPLDGPLESLGQRAAAVRRIRYAAILRPGEPPPWEGDPRFEADEAVAYAIMGHVFACCRGDGTGSILRSGGEANLLRELIGDPFRRLEVDAHRLGWSGGVVRRLAESIYRDRAFGQLPILADALEEGGCQDGKVLRHLRGPGPHTRGCHVLDLLLGKS